MKTKTKKRLKQLTAIVLCAVLLLTSIPFALAANGQYNPAPYFSDEAQQQGAAAWVDDAGVLQIRFPAASGRPTHKDWKDGSTATKAIDYYIIELSDIGPKLTKHNTNPPVLLSKKIDAVEGDTVSATFTAAEIEALGTAFNTETNRYNVSITAVDSEGWFSMSMDALVSEVPEFNYDMTGFELFISNATAMREMMLFEKEGTYTDTVQTGDSVSQIAWNSYNGVPDPATSVPSNALRVRVDSFPGASGQSIDTPISRQTYNFRGASEIWYWLDLSDVELQGLSFRLRANYKRIDWQITNGNKDGETQHHGVVYSTVGSNYHTYPAGQEPYALIQMENGSWEKITMANGTIDLGHYKGYVRIPIEYFCSETATQVTTHNIAFGHKIAKGLFENSNTYKGKVNTYYDDEVCIDGKEGHYWDADNGVTVFTKFADIDPVGTPITEALLIQQGKIKGSGIDGLELGTFLAPGITPEQITNENDSRRGKLVKDASGVWQVQNRDDDPSTDAAEGAYKAIEDVYSAGFAYQNVTTDSVNQSFFVDNIMFFRDDGKTWDPTILNDIESTGSPVSQFFDQKANAQDRILKAIEEYIGEPSWTDYRGVHYVENMMEATKQAYADKGASYADTFMTDSEMAARAAAVGKTDVWNNYVEAVSLCKEYGTYESNNSKPDELVPSIVQLLDTLPDISTMTTATDDQVKLLIRLYQSYTALNFGQLKMLGSYSDPITGTKYEEEKLLAYIDFLGEQLNQNFLTGYMVANYPFIPFNTFEENTAVGDTSWRLEDDINYNSTSDYRHMKSLTTYATNKWADFTSGGSSMNASLSGAIQNRPHTGVTEISQNGYNGSKGVTSTLTSKWLDGDGNSNDTYYCILMSKNSLSANDFDSFKSNNMSAENLGGLALNNEPALQNQTQLPFSLVMYVDFTEFVESDPDFYFVPTIHTVNNGNDVYARPSMGNVTGLGDREYWHYYYTLDNATGEWQRVYNGTGNDNLYRFTSTQAASSEAAGVNLRGYKGYIAIPLQHFKLSTTGGNLDANAGALNSIYSIQFSISGGNTYGKSFTIDNIGFTYDPAFYSSRGVDLSGRTDKSYAEVFRAKSNKAQEFEDKVASINPYDTQANLAALVAEADAIYAQLGEYQTTDIPSVIASKELLEVYRTYSTGADQPEPIVNDLAWLKNKINNEWNSIPDVSTSMLPNPGFKYPSGANQLTEAEVNYEAYGLTRESAQEIISAYNETAERLSPADYNSLTAEEIKILENAYKAATRTYITLENTKSQAVGFANSLQPLYTTYTDADGTTHRLLHAAATAPDGGMGRNDVVAMSENMYDPLTYYAKTELSNGNIIQAYANMTDGLSRYLANTKTVTLNGETVDAGVWKLAEKYTALYAEVKSQLDAKNTLSDDLASRLNEAIAEYNDLIPAYQNIFELYYGSVEADASGTYQGIKDIVDLFSVYDTAFANGTNSALLDLNPENDGTTANPATQSLNIKYIEELPVNTGEAVKTYFKVTYDGILSLDDMGTVDRAYELMIVKSDGSKVSVPSSADGVILTDEMLGEMLKNNTYTSTTPREIKFTAKLLSQDLFAQPIEDTVTITQYVPGATDADPPTKIGNDYTLTVRYTPEEAYVVTIPAEFPIDWGDTSTIDVSYQVDCVLGTGKQIEVDVNGSGKLTAVNDSSYTMDYISSNFGVKSVFTDVQNKALPASKPTVQISKEMWDTKPVGKYKDTLTYTVEYKTP